MSRRTDYGHCRNCGGAVIYHDAKFCSTRCWTEWSRAKAIRDLGSDNEIGYVPTDKGWAYGKE